jgi:hypothetical protein
MLDLLHLVDGGSTNLTDSLGDPVHSMDVRFSKLSSVGVDRKTPPQFDVPVEEKVPGFPPITEPELLELGEY